MKLFTKILFLVLSIVALNASELIHADSYPDALKKGIEQNKPVALFAHSPFCPWCRKMEAETLSDNEVIEYLNENFIFVTVDLSLSMDIEDVPGKFLPEGTPTTYIIDPKTQELLYSLRGYKNKKSFLGRISRPSN
jgi:thioredoxin-related protein